MNRRLPLWLLRDIPAFLGVMLSFWPLMILVIRSGFAAMRGKAVPRAVYDAIPIMLAQAEAKLDFAIWREAYRRLGWNHRLVTFSEFAPPQDWIEATQRFEAYRRANMNLEACARAYTDELRQRHGIARHDLTAHGSTDAALCAAAHHELAGSATSLVAASRPSTCRAEAQRRRKDARGSTHARAPPYISATHWNLHLSAPASEIARVRPYTDQIRPRHRAAHYRHIGPLRATFRPSARIGTRCSPAAFGLLNIL